MQDDPRNHSIVRAIMNAPASERLRLWRAAATNPMLPAIVRAFCQRTARKVAYTLDKIDY